MSDNNPTIVALIPARSGSKRVPHKNIRPLAGHPLIAYSISAAVNSGVFSEVLVSTDSEGKFKAPNCPEGDISLRVERREYKSIEDLWTQTSRSPITLRLEHEGKPTAIDAANDGGGPDNITALLMSFSDVTPASDQAG